MGNVDCDGNESTLAECKHHTMHFKDCIEGDEEAGVICTGTCHLFVKQ